MSIRVSTIGEGRKLEMLIVLNIFLFILDITRFTPSSV